MTAGAVTGKDHIAAVMAGEDDHVLSAARPGEGGTEIDEHGADAGGDAAFGLLCAGYLANGAAEVASVTEVHGRDRGDGLRHDLIRIDDDARARRMRMASLERASNPPTSSVGSASA